MSEPNNIAVVTSPHWRTHDFDWEHPVSVARYADEEYNYVCKNCNAELYFSYFYKGHKLEPGLEKLTCNEIQMHHVMK